MYSPKIHDMLIPSLYHAAQQREVPMTKLTDALVYQGLKPYEPSLPLQLPSSAQIIHPRLLTQEANLEWPIILSVDHPFSERNELDSWYQSAHTGLIQACAHSDPIKRSEQQAIVALQHLEAAYLAASNLVKSYCPKEVNGNAQLPA